MLLEVHPDNPNPRHIAQIVKTLEQGGVIIYPTDTVYALGCDIQQPKAVEKICRIRKMDMKKANLTFICKDISQLSSYAQQLDQDVFKLIKKCTPGPFTFILKANKAVPKTLYNKRKTIGVRIPDNNIGHAIIDQLDRPILSISLKSDDEILEYFTNPSEIYDDYENQVDIVVDGGNGLNEPSTVIDCTGNSPELIRQGLGEVDL